MIHILEAFQPDEYAHDSISPEIIATLKEEQLRAINTRPPLSDLSSSYRPPNDEVLLNKVGSLACVPPHGMHA